MRKLRPILAVLILAACTTAATGPSYMDASLRYDADSKTYAVARDDVSMLKDACDRTPATCKLTGDQWKRWGEIRAQVQAADAAFYTALVTWRDSGQRPANFDALQATLTAAQQRMIALREELR